MTWIVWRQQRPMFLTLAIGLLVGVVAVVLLRAGMVADLTARNLADCVTAGVKSCRGNALSEFQRTWYDRMQLAQVGVIALPVLIGVFIGAPLFAREFEQGTHALAFTQSVSRTRWTATKLLVAAVPALVFVGGFQFAVHSWLDAAGELGPLGLGPYYFTTFESAGVSPIAYTLFAYTFGVFAGAVFRRTLVAMTLTLGLFVVVRFALNRSRELMITPTRVTSDDPTKPQLAEPGPLQVDGGYLDASGAVVVDAGSKMNCSSAAGNDVDLLACYRRNGIAQSFMDVIPVDQATTLHLLEASVFAGLAVVFVLGSVWAVRRQA
ncbi:ABC transporter permease [Nocardia sp. NRRL S-836]|uniref:ABC transporter permease n=1 Tax=Nocardia sp. NRRL S-836 TaxID=1519492 RepID=UPI0006AFB6EB|nr:ABC transporter permease subunit [Nocardia sp. NRRL S-836]